MINPRPPHPPVPPDPARSADPVVSSAASSVPEPSVPETGDHLGVVRELLDGRWRDPDSGRVVRIPIRAIEIRDSLDGDEARLFFAGHPDCEKVAVVSDEITRDILGSRVVRALSPRASVSEVVLSRPKPAVETADDLRRRCESADALVAVGSGSVNDLVKYAAFRAGKSYDVFPTSPMNAYATGTASLTENGVKRSLPAKSARGVFFDLSVLAECPPRLIASAFGDVVCRPTAQADWRLSRAVKGGPYADTPYALLAVDEKRLLADAPKLQSRDLSALAVLVRTCVLNGLGSAVCGTTHCGSMAEHMISHYLDMFAGNAHPGTLHGEQVGAASLSVLRLQKMILAEPRPPRLRPASDPGEFLRREFGDEIGRDFAGQFAKKSLDENEIAEWNRRNEREWADFAAPMRAALSDPDDIARAMRAAGAKTSATELGFAPDFYREAVSRARFIRDRFTFLDIADDAGLLADFADAEARA